jgi:hypothetical protein
MPIEKSKIIIEKYFFNIKKRRLYKLFY